MIGNVLEENTPASGERRLEIRRERKTESEERKENAGQKLKKGVCKDNTLQIIGLLCFKNVNLGSNQFIYFAQHMGKRSA